MAEADVVVELDVPWRFDAGAPMPVVLQREEAIVVIGWASRSSGHVGENIVLTFEGCLISRFGYPNDEALPGHPLARRGLGYYGIFEVLRSSWTAELAAQNCVVFPEADWPSGEPLRHFVVTFHDSTFECLARDVEGRFSTESRAALLASATRQLGV